MLFPKWKLCVWSVVCFVYRANEEKDMKPARIVCILRLNHVHSDITTKFCCSSRKYLQLHAISRVFGGTDCSNLKLLVVQSRFFDRFQTLG